MRAAGQLVAGRMQPASLTCLLYTLWIKPLRSPSMTVLTARSSHFPPSISLDPPESPWRRMTPLPGRLPSAFSCSKWTITEQPFVKAHTRQQRRRRRRRYLWGPSPLFARIIGAVV